MHWPGPRGIARGPESTRTWAEPSQSFSSRSRSNASNPNASVNKVSVALLSSLPDSAREAVSLSCLGRTSTSPCALGCSHR